MSGTKALFGGVAGIGLDKRNTDQTRRIVYTTHIEDGIEKYKTVGQEIRWEMTT